MAVSGRAESRSPQSTGSPGTTEASVLPPDHPCLRVARRLRSSRSIAILGHPRPDADAVGSVAAMLHIAQALGIPARGYIGQSTPIPRNLSAIPGSDRVIPLDPTDSVEWESFTSAELYVVVDCGDLGRTGTAASYLAECPGRIVLIDHHASNPGFGSIDWIDSAAESTTVLVHLLARQLQVPITEELACCLYAGLVTDTGSFRWGTLRMHEVAADLLATGIDGRRLAEALMDEISVDDIRAMGEIQSLVRVVEGEGAAFVWMCADRRLLARLSPTAVESLTDVVRAQNEAPIGVLTKEIAPDTWAVSLRSTQYDVSLIAARLGGGGHRAAAGATVVATEKELLSRIREAMSAVVRIDEQPPTHP